MQIAASQQPAAIFAIAVIYPVAENSARTDGADEVQFVPAGPCALWHGQPGQVGNEAATAISCKCRRQGSPLPSKFSSGSIQQVVTNSIRYRQSGSTHPQFFQFY